MLDKCLVDEVSETIEKYENIVGIYASRTREMINRYGAIQALTKLMNSPDEQKGFKALRDKGELRYTFEAVIIKHSDKFTRQTVEVAQWRLANANSLL